MRSIVRPAARALLAAMALLSPVSIPPATVDGQVSNGSDSSSSKTSILKLEPMVITITNEFSLSRTPTSFDRAVKNIQDQMDAKRESELDKASPLGAVWAARFWDYLPKATGGSMNSPTEEDDDPFIVPSYLLLQNRILDRLVAESDARARVFFGR
jgi:hypothetical protein